MRLHDVANVFNDLVCNDAYTGAFVVKGQIDAFDGSKRDGLMSERRVLSLSPTDAIPYRRAISAAGAVFLIGRARSDDFRGTLIRTSYVVQEATFMCQVRTPAEVCMSLPGFSAYAAQIWVKDHAATQESSDLASGNSFHFALTEPVTEGMLLTFANRLQIVRSLEYGAAGTLVANAEQLPEPSVETAMVSVGAYDPVTDTVPGGSIPVKVVRMRWQSLFAYSTSVSPKFEPGDIQVAIAKAAWAPKAGATLTLSDGLWRVESVASEGQVWLCRATRYG